LPFGRALNLYLIMIKEWANQATLDRIADALEPPADWRDPVTGLPAGWSSEDDDGMQVW
jgi:hypothetical protein